MVRPSRTLRSIAAGALIAFGGSTALAAPSAVAEPVESTSSLHTAQASWHLFATCGSFDECDGWGKRGVQHGGWSQYVCIPFVNGWNLWVYN